MTRMEAERLAQFLRQCARKGIDYLPARSLTAESEWCVVTYVNGKPTERRYA